MEASERGMWDEELSLHAADNLEAERSVFRQRTLEWEMRQKPEEYNRVMLTHRFPFRVGV